MLPMVLLLLSPILSSVIVLIIWYHWSKDKLRVEKILNKQITIKKKLKRLIYKEDAPFGEIRYPVMIITVSGVIFVLITAGFGITIDTRDGSAIFDYDFGQYFDEEGAIRDPWTHRPMDQFIQENGTIIFLLMYMGYCIMLCFLIYFWFEYCKWKWEHIPIEKRKREERLNP